MVLESCKVLVNLLVPVIILLPYFVISKNFYEDEWDGGDRHTQDWCRRLRKCIPNNQTICGWDKRASFLAQFENLCILMRANCKGAGNFEEVEMVICDTRRNYSLIHPKGESNEFEWIHIEQGTSAGTTKLNTHANDTALRRQTEFFTLYSDGGTLPPDFFAVQDKVHTETTVIPKLTQHPSDSPNGRILQFLWRKAGGAVSEKVN